MERKEFVLIRKELSKTQKQMSELLGTSLKAVHSYEQGWRNIPVHVERQLLFLLFKKRERTKKQRACWTIKKCPPERKKACPAWEFRCGKLCWFVNGTLCAGCVQKSWQEKMQLCRSCNVFSEILELP